MPLRETFGEMLARLKRETQNQYGYTEDEAVLVYIRAISSRGVSDNVNLDDLVGNLHLGKHHLLYPGWRFAGYVFVQFTATSGVGAKAIAFLDVSGSIARVQVYDKGSGYSSDIGVRFIVPAGHSGRGAAATAVLDEDGGVASVIVTNGGSGYVLGAGERGVLQSIAYYPMDSQSQLLSVGETALALSPSAPANIVYSQAPESLSSILLTSRGSGYTSNPTVEVVSPTASVVGGVARSIGSGARAQAYIGAVSDVRITNGGTDYVSPPEITILGGGGGLATARVVSVASGMITAIELLSGGANYSTAPTVSISSPPRGGTRATARATVQNGVVTALNLLTGGSGYLDPLTITFPEGVTGDAASRAEAQGIVGSLPLGTTNFDIQNAGRGFREAPYVQFTGGGGSGAIAEASINSDGSIVSVNITFGGFGYSSLPSISFQGSNEVAPVVSFSNTASLVSNLAFVELTRRGYGYSAPPTVTISGGGGSGASISTTLSQSIEEVKVLDGGNGYSVDEPPTISFTGGGGSGAVGYASFASYNAVNAGSSLLETYFDPASGLSDNVKQLRYRDYLSSSSAFAPVAVSSTYTAESVVRGFFIGFRFRPAAGTPAQFAYSLYEFDDILSVAAGTTDEGDIKVAASVNEQFLDGAVSVSFTADEWFDNWHSLVVCYTASTRRFYLMVDDKFADVDNETTFEWLLSTNATGVPASGVTVPASSFGALFGTANADSLFSTVFNGIMTSGNTSSYNSQFSGAVCDLVVVTGSGFIEGIARAYIEDDWADVIQLEEDSRPLLAGYYTRGELSELPIADLQRGRIHYSTTDMRYYVLYRNLEGTMVGWTPFILPADGDLTMPLTEAEMFAPFQTASNMGDAPVLTAGAVGRGSVSWVWTPTTNASAYDWEVREGLMGDADATGEVAAFMLVRTGLSELTSYQLRIRPKNLGGAGDWTDWVTNTTPSLLVSLPGAPLRVTAGTATATTASWSWASVLDAASYDWELSSGGTVILTGNEEATSRDFVGLSASTTYQLRVRSRNSAGTSAWTSAISLTTLISAPASAPVVTAGTSTHYSVAWSWAAVTGASSYVWEFRDGITGDAGSTGSITTTSYTRGTEATPLTASSAYSIRVRARNVSGFGPWSTWVSATTSASPPIMPAIISNSAQTSTSLTWTWSLVSNATSYAWEFRTGDSGNATANGTTTSTSYTRSTLTASTLYQFRVRATNSVGNSAWTAWTSGTTLVAAPASAPTVTAGTTTHSSASWSWTEVAGAATYGWEFREGTGAVSASGTTATRSLNRASLTAETAYQLRVQAINAGGSSAWSSWVSATTMATPVPGASTVTAGAATETTLVWTWAATSPASTSYDWEVREGTTGEADSTGTTSFRTYTLMSATQGTLYQFRVRGENALGDGDWSDWQSNTTTLGVPTVSVGGATRTTATWNWTAVTGADDYDWEFRIAGATTTSATGTATALTLERTGLTENSSYELRVRAATADTEGAWSDWVSITAMLTTLTVPNVRAFGGTSRLFWAWNDVTGATGYDYEYRTPRYDSSPSSRDQLTVTEGSVTSRLVTVDSLFRHILYELRVRATAGQNVSSDWSDWSGVRVVLSTNIPSIGSWNPGVEPSNFRLVSSQLDPNSTPRARVEFAWNAVSIPTSSSGTQYTLRGYQLIIARRGTTPQPDDYYRRFELASTSTSLVITNFPASGTYSARIRFMANTSDDDDVIVNNDWQRINFTVT